MCYERGMADERNCVLLGVGSPYVYEVHESLTRAGWRVRAFLDNQNGGAGPSDLGEVRNLAAAEPAWLGLPLFIPLLTPGYRKTIAAQARDAGFREFPALADPTAIIATTAYLAAGVLINAAVTIGAKSRMAEFAIVNRSASIGHDAFIDAYATLGPGCILCGSTVIGRGAFIGAGAIINPEVKIGANCIIGAGAVVVRDVEDNCVAVGNPAKVIKTGIAGYHDVSA
jgi:sugar O-acyltransferase (sialic acid O-acetyltransferase NeuD family)